MIIKFWIGLSLAFALSILIMIFAGWYSKRRDKGAALGVLLGFFIGFAIVLMTYLIPRRIYVVTGDEQYEHFMVFGKPEYEMPTGEKKILDMTYDECYVINTTDVPVVLEEAVYGGFRLGVTTEWVEPDECFLLKSHSIYYLYDNEPPSEISVKDDSDETIRWWLRKKRD